MDFVKELKGEVVYVTTPEKAINYQWEKGSGKLRPGLEIVSIDDINKMDCDIFIGNRVMEGSLLTKHPFMPNKYIDIKKSEDIIIKSKLNCLGIIARFLGAKEYETLYAEEVTKEALINASGEMEHKLVKVEARRKVSERDNATGKYYRHETFAGEFTEENYYHAIEEAKRFGLYSDLDINYLLEVRNPKYPNQQTSQHVKIELTKELGDKLDIAFSLNVAGIFKLNADYNKVVSERKKVLLETSIKF